MGVPTWLRTLVVGNTLILRQLARIEKKVDISMSQIDELKSAVAEQSTAITTMQERVSEDVDTLKEQLSEALADKPELSQLLDNIKANTQSINTVDPVVDSLPDGGEVTPPVDGGDSVPVEEGTPDETPAEGTVDAPPAEDDTNS